MRHLPWMVLSLVPALALAPGCKRKAEPPPPPPPPVAEAPPPEPEEPPPPSCPARDALVGTWHLVTEVSPEVGSMGGVNGYYRMEVAARDGDCSAQIGLTKTGWGRGELSNPQELFGRVNVTQEGKHWKVPLAIGNGPERTDMVLWLRQGSGRLQGYFHYTNASWAKAPLFGVVEGRSEPFTDRPTFFPAPTESLASCALKGMDQVTYDTCLPLGG